MLSVIRNLLLIIFEIFCCKIFYETFGPVRCSNRVSIVQLTLLSGCACFVGFSLSGYFFLRQVIIIFVFSVFMFWHIKISMKISVVLAILFEALLLAVDYTAYSINSKLFLNSGLIKGYDMPESIMVVLLGKAILFLCVLYIRKQFGKKFTEMLVDTEWLRFLFFPVFTIVAISAMLSVFNYVDTPGQANLLFIIAFGMAGMNIVVFYLINDIVRREMKLHETKIFQLQAKNQAEMYQSISENFERQKRKTHEYKNQITCIESLLGKKQYRELEEYVKGIQGGLKKELDAINTNHVIVNAILNTKYQEAAEKEIVFVFRVNDLSKLTLKDEDVVTILSNLLNNAIEACEKCEEKKIIKLKFVLEDGRIIIAVKNTFSIPLCYENGEIKSTKLRTPEEHGVGIKNIVKVIEKYNGSYIIEEQEGEFYFSIMIPV